LHSSTKIPKGLPLPSIPAAAAPYRSVAPACSLIVLIPSARERNCQDASAAADLLRPLTDVYGAATVTDVTLTAIPSPPPPEDLKILGVPMPTNDVGLAGLFLVHPLQPYRPKPLTVLPFARPFAVGAWAVPRSVRSALTESRLHVHEKVSMGRARETSDVCVMALCQQ
jgi:hypothetical protein